MVFVIFSLFIVNFRRSTTGLALNAARWSEAGARTSGISVVQMKVIAGSLAALVAGIGGALYAMAQTSFQPSEFATFAGVVWLAVLVTIGVRSTAAALIAGLTLVFPNALFSYYLPSATWLTYALSIGFGLGAISAAKYPDGALAEQSRRLQTLLLRFRPARSGGETPGDFSMPAGVRDRGRRAADHRARVVTTTEPAPAGTPATAPGTSCALSASGVTVRFGGLMALADVSIEVQPGAIAGLVGPNGAGKSTLLGVLSGLQRANAGTVSLCGEDVTRASPRTRARKRVGAHVPTARALPGSDCARAPRAVAPRPCGTPPPLA